MKSVDIVIPVYNEEHVLEKSIDRLRSFLKKNLKDYRWKIIVANNASTDKTLDVAKKLSKKHSDVTYFHLNKKGRGRALRAVWSRSKADISSYMDVDLSTELKAFPKMIDALAEKKGKKYAVGTGTRLTKNSKTKRSLFREILSRGYNFIVKLILWTEFSDAQCGFKAITKEAGKVLLPLTKDNKWFFDTELLVYAEKKKMGIFEVPVKWIEDTDSRVNIINTIIDFLSDVINLRIRLWKEDY